jgi:hypothetical protein
MLILPLGAMHLTAVLSPAPNSSHFSTPANSTGVLTEQKSTVPKRRPLRRDFDGFIR